MFSPGQFKFHVFKAEFHPHMYFPSVVPIFCEWRCHWTQAKAQEPPWRLLLLSPFPTHTTSSPVDFISKMSLESLSSFFFLFYVPNFHHFPSGLLQQPLLSIVYCPYSGPCFHSLQVTQQPVTFKYINANPIMPRPPTSRLAGFSGSPCSQEGDEISNTVSEAHQVWPFWHHLLFWPHRLSLFSPKLFMLKAGFLIDFLGWLILWCGGCLVHCMVFNSIPSFNH